ncbi:methyltransferase [Brevibacterium sp. BRM-1]|uniref:class I SAM-dependent RNA methyltransferase n=1 Tax=Brevibacterium sp. BRM-1 TaxID=2999062 RepID=UPI00227DE308|nr:methyltransferase domain-containing protein [Brevibacterium sp. BRM-1]WAL41048.1 methyltransferase [Brevibacterium sp. BRM-1]
MSGPADAPAPGGLSVGAELVLRPEASAAGGQALARTPDGVVFVSGAIPGEEVRARVHEVRRGFARAAVLEVLEASPHRVPDRRLALGAAGAGGMEFAHVELAHSRALKAAALGDQLRRIGGIDVPVDLIPAPGEAAAEAAAPAGAPAAQRAGLGWRTRVQLAVDPAGTPGAHAAGSHDVVPVATLPLAVPELEALGLHRLSLPGAERVEMAVGSGPEPTGAVIVSGAPSAPALTAVRTALGRAQGEWSLFARAGGQRNRGGRGRGRARGRGSGAAADPQLLAGDGRVAEQVTGAQGAPLRFRLRGDGFWQVHRDAAQVLADAVAAAAGGAGSVLDLYCGAGLFSVRLAAQPGVRVHGIEGSAAAIAAARDSAAANGTAATFAAARIESLERLPEAQAVVVDPPRAGLGARVVEAILASPAERLVYVSCDGATFARDARGLAAGGFALASFAAHDLFPLTAHQETVAVFAR